MSCIKAVAEANDAKLIQVHKLFKEWKKNNTHRKVSTDYGLAIRHFKKCVRYITKMCNTFGPNAHVTYARTMVTTQVIDDHPEACHHAFLPLLKFCLALRCHVEYLECQ